MRYVWCALLAGLFVATAALGQPLRLSPFQSMQGPAHNRKFWLDISKSRYAIPEGENVFSLVRELNEFLGSPDPQLRDDLAYSIMDVWIVRRQQLTAPELLSLAEQWQSNLKAEIGESSTDTVFLRSFSALCLAALAERDLRTPFLGEERYNSMLKSALEYLRAERDLRGFDPTKGWIHATAHTGDLLAFLAANPLLRAEDQPRILHAIAERLSSAHQIFSYEEQDRLAFAVSSIVARQDFDFAAFHKWLASLDESDRQVWKNSPPDDNQLKTFQNNSYLLQALVARLCAQPKSSAVASALDQVIEVLHGR